MNIKLQEKLTLYKPVIKLIDKILEKHQLETPFTLTHCQKIPF